MSDTFLSDIGKNKRLHIAMLLDDSGSMGGIAPATRSGVNEFIDSQRAIEDDIDTEFNLFKFSTPGSLQKIVDGIDIEFVEHISDQDYSPTGYSTALYDSISQAIELTEKEVSEEKDTTVLFVIMTDGGNNAGITQRAEIFDRVTELEATDKWKFVYLGANQDSYAASHGMGISGGATMDWAANDQGVKWMTGATGRYTTSIRSAMSTGTNIGTVSFVNGSGGGNGSYGFVNSSGGAGGSAIVIPQEDKKEEEDEDNKE